MTTAARVLPPVFMDPGSLSPGSSPGSRGRDDGFESQPGFRLFLSVGR